LLDIKFIRENSQAVEKACIDKGEPNVVANLLEIDERRREMQTGADQLRHELNDISDKVGEAFKNGNRELGEELKTRAREISQRIKELENTEKEIHNLWKDLMLRIPNMPSEDTPIGGEDNNRVIGEWGDIREYDFELRDHVDLGGILGILDMPRGAKISGSGFPLLCGDGSRMARALISLMLDTHAESGFLEYSPPFLANRNAMMGSAQIPKLEDDMYHIEGDDLFLIPTSEVPLTNLRAGEILEESDLPLYYTAFSANFRREAGSYGADTRGLLRVHQFDKVEIVKIVHPDKSWDEHESLLSQAEKVLRLLKLPYRVLLLASGDMSFASAKVYDLETWSPGEAKWLEVSSCSNFLEFQARRANIKFRPEGGGSSRYVHTLNASGLALPRILISIWETYQNEDATITIPDVLQPYMGGQTLIKPRF